VKTENNVDLACDTQWYQGKFHLDYNSGGDEFVGEEDGQDEVVIFNETIKGEPNIINEAASPKEQILRKLPSGYMSREDT
jgi:hypothetical protein